VTLLLRTAFCNQEPRKRGRTNLKSPVLNLTVYHSKKFIPAFLAVVLILLGGLGFSQTFSYPFVHDDLVFIRGNPDIARLDHWRDIFTRAPSSQGVVNAYYRPGLELLYRIQYAFFKFDAGAYHGFNVALHILNGLLLFYVFLRILSGYEDALARACHRTGGPAGTARFLFIPPSLWLAWSAAVIFVIHPVQTESVACVAGVSNLLLVFFGLLGFILFLRLAEGRERRRGFVAGEISLLGGIFAAALCVKEQAVVLPFLFLSYLLTIGRARQKSGRSPVLAITFLFVLLGGYFCYRKILLGHSVTPFWNYNYELFLRLKAIPRTLLVYLRILFIPSGLHYYRSLDVLAPNAGASLIFVLVVAAMFAGGRVLPSVLKCYYQFGLLWFAVTLAPMLNVVPLIHEYSYIALFEHFLYWPLPGIPLSVLVGVTYVLESRVPPERYKTVRAGFILSVILILTAITLKQNQVWRGEVPLFEQVVRHERNLARGRLLLGKAYFFNDQTEKALQEFNQALQILDGYLERVRDPGARDVYLSFKKEALFNIAQCFERQRQWPRAVQYYRAALQIAPNDSMILNNLGAVFLQGQQIEEAEQWLARAVAADPKDLMAKTNLALCYIFLGKETQARELLEAVLLADPGFVPARNNLDILTNNPGAEPAGQGLSSPPG